MLEYHTEISCGTRGPWDMDISVKINISTLLHLDFLVFFNMTIMKVIKNIYDFDPFTNYKPVSFLLRK